MRKEVRKHVRSLLRQMQKKDRDEGRTRSHDEKRENRAQGDLRGLRYLRPELLEGQKIGNSLARRFDRRCSSLPARLFTSFSSGWRRTGQNKLAMQGVATLALLSHRHTYQFAEHRFSKTAYFRMPRHDGGQGTTIAMNTVAAITVFEFSHAAKLVENLDRRFQPRAQVSFRDIPLCGDPATSLAQRRLQFFGRHTLGQHPQ